MSVIYSKTIHKSIIVHDSIHGNGNGKVAFPVSRGPTILIAGCLGSETSCYPMNGTTLTVFDLTFCQYPSGQTSALWKDCFFQHLLEIVDHLTLSYSLKAPHVHEADIFYMSHN